MFSLPLHITGYWDFEPHITTHLLGWYWLKFNKEIFGWETKLFPLLAHTQWGAYRTFQLSFRHRVRVLTQTCQSLVHKDDMNAYYWMKGTFFVVIQNPAEYQTSSISGIWIKFSVFACFRLQWKNGYSVSVFWLTPAILASLTLNPTNPLRENLGEFSQKLDFIHFCLHYAGMS